MASVESSLVFVYGTLKRGFPNYDESLYGSCYCGIGKSVDTYPLLIAGKFYSPVLVAEKGSGLNVSGELYDVGSEILCALDRLEGVGETWGYYRINIEIRQESGSVVSATTYVKNSEDLGPIHSGPLSSYEIDERYVHPSLR
jgi:gamma-glutamylaminecyclotransferase